MYIAETVGGGVRKHLSLLLDELLDKYELVVVHGKRIDEIFLEKKELYAKKGVKFYEINDLQRNLDFKKDIVSFKEIYQVIKKEKPDIVHCHSSKAGILGRIGAKLVHVNKIFYTPHSYAFQATEFSKTKKRFFAHIEKIASKWFTTKSFNVSKGEMIEALNWGIDKPEKFEVIYNGLPTQTNYPPIDKESLGIPKDAVVIGNCSRVTLQKNPYYFVNLAQKAISNNDKLHFVWIGDGLQEEIEKYNALSPNIHFIGFRDNAELLMSCFDVFLMTSYYEGLPYVLVEALRAGKPIIATNVVGNNEIVKENKTGYLIPVDEFELDLTSVINRAMQLDEREIRSEFENNFTLEKMIKSIVANYEKKSVKN